ncbi:type II toxin-antitoxin system prevent-host-death family antitoxin [Chelatococcus sambhunathii]|uniref:Antitoxin n=1 Tax=Chelatococcus sambhunathii TaxID=363953 RepID=A0ABU1DHB7_9HYPH|nr:type II toxin-antitoxin system prevent-host-death family antitoxin [Chelatococcus sambhunathii]MDR4307518.1 type II toxin-antitoxin system prevent-host-death family antitoxin [Chelatococcus sambhunathii]
MKHVSVVEARSHFSALLTEVEAGEEIAITRHGKVVARLAPEHPRSAADLFRALAADGGWDFEAPEDLPAEAVASWDD